MDSNTFLNVNACQELKSAMVHNPMQGQVGFYRYAYPRALF